MRAALLLLGLAVAPLHAQGTLGVSGLRLEYLENPVGIDAARPRFSWQLVSDRRSTMQTAYQVEVAASESALSRGSGLLWDTGKVPSDQSVFVEYGGPAVASRTRYFWRVRVWDAAGRVSRWSPVPAGKSDCSPPMTGPRSGSGPASSREDSCRAPSP